MLLPSDAKWGTLASMKLLYVADGRSPIALSWISFFIRNSEEVHLVSTFLCSPIDGLASFQVIPVGLSQAQGEGRLAGKSSLLRKVLPVGMRTRLRQWIAPFTLTESAVKLRLVIDELRPDLVHAMRIPYEGMLASLAFEHDEQRQHRGKDIPLVMSVWGNDFTLHAGSTPWMADHTRRALHQADALHTDCQRDQRLAREWGYAPGKPSIVLPCGGGIRTDVFNPGGMDVKQRAAVVINPRGFRAYVRNDTFFQAIPRVLERQPETRFLCPTMQAEPEAQKWIADYGIGSSVELLPYQTPQGMADLYHQSQVIVSLTTHDGTPNTLLEALACGCFPVVGDLESLREWITHGKNGLLVDPGNPHVSAEAILLALSNPELRSLAAEMNIAMIRDRVEYEQVMGRARELYQSLIKIK